MTGLKADKFHKLVKKRLMEFFKRANAKGKGLKS
jgi:hypothetical protein